MSPASSRKSERVTADVRERSAASLARLSRTLEKCLGLTARIRETDEAIDRAAKPPKLTRRDRNAMTIDLRQMDRRLGALRRRLSRHERRLRVRSRNVSPGPTAP